MTSGIGGTFRNIQFGHAPYFIDEIGGLRSYRSRGGPVTGGGTSGGTATRLWAEPRSVPFTVLVAPEDDTDIDEAVDDLCDAMYEDVAIRTDPCVFQLIPDAPTLTIFAQVVDRDPEITEDYAQGVCRVSVELVCPDPYIYGPEQTVELPRGVPTLFESAGKVPSQRMSISMPGPMGDGRIETFLGDSAVIRFHSIAADEVRVDLAPRELHTTVDGLAYPAGYGNWDAGIVKRPPQWPIVTPGAQVWTYTTGNSDAPPAVLTYRDARL